MFCLNIINLFGWGLSKRFIVFEFLSATALGMVIAKLSYLANKDYNKYFKFLFLSFVFGLITIPFTLHYSAAIKLLDKTIGTNPSISEIYLEGLFYGIKKILYVVILSYPIIASINFLKKFLFLRKEKREQKIKN